MSYGCLSNDCRPLDDIEMVHKVNVIGPLRVSQAMLPLLKKGNKKVVSIADSLLGCPSAVASCICLVHG